eukprot:CAMPEP_0117666956 /NCGR_PEP_ID=MMETSP0804-20121206/10677_1 /TAXON_ID=1074897 /ORGANISM="Tetraselmis astigmatica, Strain CCMP880" /LENGTH=617 /DNA_ID=CAMNT_0005474585 /DNA_START=142 /DNA_END=1993 /DNA_ORIENTATION=+
MKRSAVGTEEEEFLGKQSDDEPDDLGGQDSDLYAVLNLPHDASEEEVQRAYRSMAKTFHPDKHQDESIHAAASQSFNRINEAYTVLSDPVKRQIYDIYGMEGLNSGLEVGSANVSKDELRQQWEQFKQQKKKVELDHNVNYRGMCVLGMNAEDVMEGVLPRMATANMVSSVEAPLSQKDSVSIGGQIVTKAGVGGGGGFVMGYRRDFSSNSSLDLHAEAGLRQVLQLTSTRQLSTHSTASLSANWSQQGGVGLEVSTHRHLSDRLSGDLTWTVGPRGADGVSLALRNEHSEKTTLTGALHVGAQTGITGSCIRGLSKKSALRVGFKLGSMGIESELGVTRKMGHYGTAGVSVSVGIQGGYIQAEVEQRRPEVLLSVPGLQATLTGGLPWPAPFCLPWMVIILGKRLIVKPYLINQRVRATNAVQAETMGALRQRLTAAASERRLLDPVSRRKTKKEVGKAGLVVVQAVYGAVEAIHSLGILPQQGSDAFSQHDLPAEGPPAPLGDSTSSPQPAANWIDVTTATQFLVENSQLTLHQGVSKAGLMGFCDIAPGQLKELRILFLSAGQPCLARVGDLQGCSLPSGGAPLDDEEETAAVIQFARSRGLAGSNQLAASSSQ